MDNPETPKKYIDENLGESPNLLNLPMNFAEFANVRSGQNVVP